MPPVVVIGASATVVLLRMIPFVLSAASLIVTVIGWLFAPVSSGKVVPPVTEYWGTAPTPGTISLPIRLMVPIDEVGVAVGPQLMTAERPARESELAKLPTTAPANAV